ncbi:MAG: hypothetical protein IPI38_19720 [Gemmatimonadetes bacterium]|nr:hypothetical protein [Gemmatimonadota bacterium]
MRLIAERHHRHLHLRGPPRLAPDTDSGTIIVGAQAMGYFAALHRELVGTRLISRTTEAYVEEVVQDEAPRTPFSPTPLAGASPPRPGGWVGP